MNEIRTERVRKRRLDPGLDLRIGLRAPSAPAAMGALSEISAMIKGRVGFP